MILKFSKYQGAGNDFIIFDCRDIDENHFTESIVKQLCNRNFGIGADGLILLLESKESDFRMKYFNSDGKEGSMCGNGGRCITAFAKSMEIIDNECFFDGIDGGHEAKCHEDGMVSLKMSDVDEVCRMKDGILIETGSRHFVQSHDSIKDIDVPSIGKSIRYQKRFGKEGTNVNFIELANDEVIIRTYERGVENETLACGTGAVAAAIYAYISGRTDKTSYIVHAAGGNLKIEFNPQAENIFRDIWLHGPAVYVFEGIIQI